MNRAKKAEKEELAAVVLSTVCFRQIFFSFSNKAEADQSGEKKNNPPHKKANRSSVQLATPFSMSLLLILQEST